MSILIDIILFVKRFYIFLKKAQSRLKCVIEPFDLRALLFN